MADIDWMKDNGANFVVLHWNSGYLEKPGYVRKLVDMACYAREMGLRVELGLHSRGLKPGSTWDAKQITVGSDEIIEDWDRLLSTPGVARTLSDCVDIFAPIVELETMENGSHEYITWPEAKNLELRTIGVIRSKLGNQAAIVSFTGPGFAGNASAIPDDPPNIDDYAVEVHPYQWIDEVYDFETTALALRAKGIAVYVGEMGHNDPMTYTEALYQFLIEHRIGFAVYAVNSNSDYPKVLHGIGGMVTESGTKAIEYWNR